MKDTFTKLSQIDISGIKNWLITLAVIMLLSSIGLGWLVNGVLIIIGLILIAPIVAVLFLGLWVKSNQVIDNCPMCNYEITGVNGLQIQCPSCGEPLKIEKGKINRIAPPGTIDVEAVEVSD
jgi:predicted RNA-binding Zn-ribbon protein involved in translation (DUF1610 family)